MDNCIHEEERLIRDEKQFAFLKIKLTDKGPDAQLMRWNDAAGECEQLILLKKIKNDYQKIWLINFR